MFVPLRYICTNSLLFLFFLKTVLPSNAKSHRWFATITMQQIKTNTITGLLLSMLTQQSFHYDGYFKGYKGEDILHRKLAFPMQ